MFLWIYVRIRFFLRNNGDRINKARLYLLQQWVNDIFLTFAPNIYCGCLLEPPQKSGSNKYPQFIVLSQNKKNSVYLANPTFFNMKCGLPESLLHKLVNVIFNIIHSSCGVYLRFTLVYKFLLNSCCGVHLRFALVSQFLINICCGAHLICLQETVFTSGHNL